MEVMTTILRRLFLNIAAVINLYLQKMPYSCCASRCFNTSLQKYSLVRFPKENYYRKAWSDAVFGEDVSSNRSLENLRLCEVHFEPTDLLVVGNRKEIKKDAIPSRFCRCPVVSKKFYSSCDIEHSYCKLQSKKRKEEETHVRNVKRKNDTLESSATCEMIDENTTEIIKKIYKKQVCAIKHEINCPFTVAPMSTNEIKGMTSTTKLHELTNNISSKDNCLQCDINTDIMEFSNKKSQNVENNIQKKYKENKHKLQNTDKSNYWMQQLKKISNENTYLKTQNEILNNCLQETKHFLADDQLRVIRTGTSRGIKWSEDTILKGLSLRFTCGSRGYNYLRQVMAPLPSVRTLQRSIEHIKFDPGLLDNVFLRLQEMASNMNEKDKNCVLLFDEMSIEQRVDLDPSTGAYIGYTSLPGIPKQIASKALVFLIAGIRKRYKQVVAYHFTASKAYHEAVMEVIMKILEICEQIGFKVLALVCDMGNRGLLARLGFSHKKDLMIYSRTHPFNENRLLYAMPDFIHVFKSLKEMFMKNKIMVLPDDVVHTEKLVSNIVDFGYIEWFEDYQLNMDLKFAPHLKKTNLKPSHFSKMKVSTATNVINYHTAGALLHVSQLRNDLSMQTTAWFVLLLRQWFKIMTSRNITYALSFYNMEHYNKAVSIICLVSNIMKHADFGKDWKVVQTHAVMCCEAALELQNYLLVNEGFEFVCMGRFLQDSIENEFSNIRIQRPKPSARDFKFRLKQLCVARCHQKIDSASYDFDDSVNLIRSFIKKQKENINPSLTETTIIFPHLNNCKKISKDEEEILYKICGHVVYKLKARIKCANCYSKLLYSGNVPHPRANFTLSSELIDGALVKVSDEVYQLLRNVEIILQNIKHQLKNIKSSVKLQIQNHIYTALSHVRLSTCHDIRPLLLNKFIGMRLYQLSATLSLNPLDQSASSAFGSKSMGSRLLADNFKPSSNKVQSSNKKNY